MRTRSRRTARFPVALLFASTGLMITGCSQRETAVEAGLRTQTLHIGNNAEPPDLDPHTNNSTVVGFILDALFEGLVRVANDGTTVLPGVAERWEISPDGLVYTFHLRADARWSNGDPVTADDIVAGFRRVLEPKLGCEGVNITFPIVGARDFLEGRNPDWASVGVKAVDPRTVRINLRFRTPYFLGVLGSSTLAPLHQPSLDKFGGRSDRRSKWTQPGNLISNGPFVLKEWKPNTVLVVARNPQYWDAGRVRLNEIHFHPLEDSSTEERAFRSGQLHVTYGLPFSKLESYRQRHAPELQLTPILRTNFVSFSTQRPPFNDARVRRAFSLAIDRERLAASVLKGLGDPAYTFVRPGTGGYDLGKYSRHDPAEARRLLREAGFPDGHGFPAVEYTLGSRSEDVLTVAQAVQRMWQETLGVKVQLAPTEFKVWLDILRTKSFAITADNWNMGVNDPHDMLALGVTGDPNNDAGWSHAPYDATFALIAAAPDDNARREAMAACERIIAEEVPYAPVFHVNRAQLVHPSVRGWRGNALQQIDWTALSLAAP
jgi:oligopeptide transport system substrate-binding protein